MPAPVAEYVPLVTLKRRIQDEKRGQVKDLYEEIGRLPARQIPLVQEWRRPFYVASAPDVPIEIRPPGSVDSQILRETIELEGPRLPIHRSKFLSLAVEWTNQWQSHLLLHGDPIAAITIRDFEPCADWLLELDRRQTCPFCRGHASIVRDIPSRSWRTYHVGFVCVRRTCQFIKSWEFADRALQREP